MINRVLLLVVVLTSTACAQDAPTQLNWSELPALPNALGVAGPFCGVHQDALIVAGGANFPKPIWETNKVWHDTVHVLTEQNGSFRWRTGGELPTPIAYGAAVSLDEGVLCMGGNDGNDTFDRVFLLKLDRTSRQIAIENWPSLPLPCAYGSATRIGDVVYLAGGQSGNALDTAMNNLWALDLSKRSSPNTFQWQELEPIPGPSRAFNLTIAVEDSVFVVSGRHQDQEQIQFLRDLWRYTPATKSWKRLSDAPQCVMAGTGVASANAIVVLGGADGSLFHKTDQLKDDHPGFPRQSWTYDVAADAWRTLGPTPANHVTTVPVAWKDAIIIPSGEVRPRVRSPKIWRVDLEVQR
ncbi:MAG: kelch repeat-containing protein [Rubripirellula sp.]